jgi:DNA-binding beta-propeller fold protein YncE
MPNTDTIYVANAGDNTISVIDRRTRVCLTNQGSSQMTREARTNMAR